MINGIIKLFYSEVVKTKMKSMPNKEYDIREEFKDISNIAMKVDCFFLISFKILVTLIIISVSLKINILFGIGTILILLIYGINKLQLLKKVTNQFKYGVKNIKSNFELSSKNMITDKIKQKINSLICLLFIGLFSDFSYIIIACFIVVFMFTIKDIYSNIKR